MLTTLIHPGWAVPQARAFSCSLQATLNCRACKQGGAAGYTLGCLIERQLHNAAAGPQISSAASPQKQQQQGTLQLTALLLCAT
jgi:hypothetical protein